MVLVNTLRQESAGYFSVTPKAFDRREQVQHELPINISNGFTFGGMDQSLWKTHQGKKEISRRDPRNTFRPVQEQRRACPALREAGKDYGKDRRFSSPKQ